MSELKSELDVVLARHLVHGDIATSVEELRDDLVDFITSMSADDHMLHCLKRQNELRADEMDRQIASGEIVVLGKPFEGAALMMKHRGNWMFYRYAEKPE